MSIQTIKCDIFEAPIDILCHGCNCQHIRGGLAGEVDRRFSEAKEADLKTLKGKEKLGTGSIAKIIDPKTRIKYVFNLYSQNLISNKQRMSNYEAIFRSLEWAKNKITNTNLVIGFPYLFACGRGGANWEIVYKMIEVVFRDSPISVLICQKS